MKFGIWRKEDSFKKYDKYVLSIEKTIINNMT